MDEVLNLIESVSEGFPSYLCHFNTYEEVIHNGQSTVSTKMVITTKNGTAKARLVVRGFEEMYILPTDSPTVWKWKGAMRVVLATVSSKRWLLKTTGIDSISTR